MKWTLQSNAGNPSEFQLVSATGNQLTFKYSATQHSIRMHFNEHYGVYVIDEGSFDARKFVIRNIYGSPIGTITKEPWRGISGQLILDGLKAKVNYQLHKKDQSIEIEAGLKTSTIVLGNDNNEQYMLALIVYAWMQSVTATQPQVSGTHQ